MTMNVDFKITNEDCMQLMSRYEDNHFDLAIVDPPYGIGFDGHNTITKEGHKGFSTKRKLHESKEWDSKRPSIEYFNEVIRTSKNQIIWGGNYFADLLTPQRGWVFWDKKITNSNNNDFSDGELAWTSFDSILKRFTYDWIGFGYLNNPQKEKKIHPTQKPVALYKWLLKNYAKEGDKILDTHLGSGSIALACHDMKFNLTGCELDKDYYDAAMKRLKNHQNQLQLF